VGHSNQAQADSHPSIDPAEADNHHPAVTTEHNMDEMADHNDEMAEHAGTDLADPAEAHLDEHAPAPTSDSLPTEAASGHGGHSGGHGAPAVAELAADPTPGEYHGQVNFAEEGHWLVKVNFLVQGQAREVEFIVDVVERGPNWYVLGGFAAVNTLVIATAAVLKQKAVKV
jgi:hypothetical protein